MMYPWAVPGAKVVCVKPHSGNRHLLPVTDPILGETYTIREVTFREGEPGVLLEEIYNPSSPTKGIEYGFYLYRFRPLTTRTQEQDVAMFTHLLTDGPVDA